MIIYLREDISLNPECMYCSKDERLSNLMIEICPLSVSTLFLFKEQTHLGRCVIALNQHERELFLLSEEKRNLLMGDIARVARAVEEAFQPDKINYGAYGDTMPHVHFHIVPKYKDGEAWSKPFEMNPAKVYLSDEEYQATISKIVAHL
jgi:diadenosine tetraphosphate (Ap4A) HIT family hydrolase